MLCREQLTCASAPPTAARCPSARSPSSSRDAASPPSAGSTATAPSTSRLGRRDRHVGRRRHRRPQRPHPPGGAGPPSRRVLHVRGDDGRAAGRARRAAAALRARVAADQSPRATSGGGVLVSRRLLRPGCGPCSPESPSRTTPRPHRPHRGPSSGGGTGEPFHGRRVGRRPAGRNLVFGPRSAAASSHQRHDGDGRETSHSPSHPPGSDAQRLLHSVPTRCGRERITPFAVRGAGRPGPPAAPARWSPAGWRCRGRGPRRRPSRVRAPRRRGSDSAAPAR